MVKSSELKEFLTIREVCHFFNVHPNTLRNWDRNGKLKAIRIGPRKDRRYKKDDVLSFFYGKESKKKKLPRETFTSESESLEPLGSTLPGLEGEGEK